MQPPQSPAIPIDPALALYPPYYPYPQPQHPIHTQHLSLPQHYSSPSSQGSESLGTPPTDHIAFPNGIGKRSASIINPAQSGSRKKPRNDDDDDMHSPAPEKDEGKAKPTRGSRACTVCRRLKMKCVGAEQGPPCKRCQAGNHQCIFEESNRGKRSSKKHEILTRSLRKMEQTLDTVLRSIGNPSIASGMVSRSPSPSTTAATQALLASPSPPPPPLLPNQPPPGSPRLHSLPDNSLNPLGLLAEASLANRRAQLGSQRNVSALSARSTDTGKVGVASDNYFRPGPMTILPLRRLYIERQVQPEMLSFVGTDDVVALFNIYFEHINMHCNLLDRDFHSPSLVCSRSPFLLTTVCAISSKFYTARPDLHPRLTELAKKLSFTVPSKGYKSVEIVQAYLLLTLWGCGAVERYELDGTWMMLGMAIRMATDLNLHRKTAVTSSDSQEGRARDREVHNRERTWILCYCLDRSFSAQMGKPHSIKEDFVLRNASQWYRSPAAIPSDATLAAYLEFQRILSRSLDILYSGTTSASGLQVEIDYLLVIKTFEAQMVTWQQDWVTLRGAWGDKEIPVIANYKKLIAKLYYNYAMLVINSFGLQNALERSPVDIGHFFARCHNCATTVATVVRDELGPSGFMRYSPDSHFVQTSYAVLSLLKLLRPEFQAYLDDEQKTVNLVKDVADVLGTIAANPLHTPALYSGFLRAIISAKADNHTGSSSQSGEGSPPPPPPSSSSSSHPNDSIDHQVDPTSPVEGSLSNPFAGYNMNGECGGGGGGGGSAGGGSDTLLNEFHFDGEMGPVADMSTFPPTMASCLPDDNMGMSMDSLLTNGFWDNVLMPGYSNSMEGLSGGFVFGVGGSGILTPRFGQSPTPSGANTPSQGHHHHHHHHALSELTQQTINAAFDYPSSKEGMLIKSDV